ncbi:MAG: hypothetical protein EOO08_13555 [Chitinophagaceae bacterium]|nr:MAG: hypothetical protein EOO08_13555 [Chitinophagaceae bacterium]
MKKQLLSLLTVLLFGLLAMSSKVNKIHINAFQYNNNVEEASPQGNYVELNDGSKVYGSKISWKTGLLVKDQIKIDDQKFKLAEARGYRQGSTYYIRHKNDFIQRIVHGPRVNVYVQFTQVTQTTTDSRTGAMRTRTYTRTDHWAEKDNDGKLIGVAGQKDIQKLLADCPLSVEMASLSNGKMRKAIKADRNYLNSIFDVYNNGCK